MTKLSLPLLILPILLSLQLGEAFGQTKSTTNAAEITVAQLSGNWDWEYLEVQGKPLTRKRDYYATGLRIDGDKFIMDFSEAACAGTIIQENNVLILRPSESDRIDYHYQDSEVLKIKGDRLYIVFRSHIWPMFVNSNQHAAVIYCYRKRR
jgi:hypothetical protein